MMRVNVSTKLAFLVLAGFTLSGCLGNSRPDATFPNALRVSPPRGGTPVVIGGRVEASRSGIATLERRVVLTADGNEVGRGTLNDARVADAAPVAINGAYQGNPVAANCGNREISEPPGQRGGIIHRLTFAEVLCQVNYAGRPAGTLTMAHSPLGAVIDAPAPPR